MPDAGHDPDHPSTRSTFGAAQILCLLSCECMSPEPRSMPRGGACSFEEVSAFTSTEQRQRPTAAFFDPANPCCFCCSVCDGFRADPAPKEVRNLRAFSLRWISLIKIVGISKPLLFGKKWPPAAETRSVLERSAARAPRWRCSPAIRAFLRCWLNVVWHIAHGATQLFWLEPLPGHRPLSDRHRDPPGAKIGRPCSSTTAWVGDR